MKDNKTDEKSNVVYCHTTPDGMKYYGVSKNVKGRWFPSHYKMNNTPFKDAIERFGWKNIKHEVLYENLTHEEALKLEDQLIVKARVDGNSLNVNRSGHYNQSEEYREGNITRRKVWREANKEKDNAYMREYMREYRKRKKGNGGKK